MSSRCCYFTLSTLLAVAYVSRASPLLCSADGRRQLAGPSLALLVLKVHPWN